MATRHILVRGTKTGLPYSKGLLASSVMATGLSPASAYAVAEQVERRLHDDGRGEVSVDDLRRVAAEVLAQRLGDDAASRYLQWQRAQERNLPLILLIGGATGVGKSTVATQVAGRLGITRIVSTDAVREVMRSMVSPDLLPTLHVSSFEAGEVSRDLPGGTDRLLVGFLRQTSAVTIGVRQVIRRAVSERTDMVVEGVHCVPGLLELPTEQEAIVVQVILTVEDEDVHRSHFDRRPLESPGRHGDRYLAHLTQIRRIQDELITLAGEEEVPRVRSYALDATVSQVTSLVVDALSAAAPQPIDLDRPHPVRR